VAHLLEGMSQRAAPEGHNVEHSDGSETETSNALRVREFPTIMSSCIVLCQPVGIFLCTNVRGCLGGGGGESNPMI